MHRAIVATATGLRGRPEFPSPGPLILEDQPEPFVPKTPRSEAEQDRVRPLPCSPRPASHERTRLRRVTSPV